MHTFHVLINDFIYNACLPKVCKTNLWPNCLGHTFSGLPKTVPWAMVTHIGSGLNILQGFCVFLCINTDIASITWKRLVSTQKKLPLFVMGRWHTGKEGRRMRGCQRTQIKRRSTWQDRGGCVGARTLWQSLLSLPAVLGSRKRQDLWSSLSIFKGVLQCKEWRLFIRWSLSGS